MLENIATAIGAVIMLMVVVIVVSLVVAVPVYYLWNWLMPSIFDIKAVSLWEAWGLAVLSGFFFKSSAASKSK
jgi:hypothetical protein